MITKASSKKSEIRESTEKSQACNYEIFKTFPINLHMHFIYTN